MLSIHKELMREYDNLRLRAEKEADRRLEDIHEKFPRIKEIDGLLGATGVSLARMAISADSEKQGKIQALKEQNASLRQERAQILQDSGCAPDYTEISHKCGVCKDSGYVNNEKCNCYKARYADKLLLSSGLKSITESENFDSFRLDVYSTEIDPTEGISPRENMENIFAACKRFCDTFGKKYVNLLLYGHVGLGKTFLCNCIAKELMARGHSCMYTSAVALFKKVKDEQFAQYSPEPSAAAEYLSLVNSVDLLIIDDLGTEFPTVLTSSALFDFINTRCLNQKPVVISTNLDLEKIQELYSERLSSRLMGNYLTLSFFGEDIRQTGKYR